MTTPAVRRPLSRTALALTGVLLTPLAAAAAQSDGDATGSSATTASAGAAAQDTVVRTIAEGVTLEEITTGQVDENDFWTVHVYLPDTIDGPLNTAGTGLGPREIADRVADALRAKGYEPRLELTTTPDFADHTGGELGWTVRVGRYATSEEAADALTEIRAAGFAGGTRYTAQDGTDPLAPQQVFVLRVDFDEFDGTVGAEHGATVNKTETLQELLADTGALAGTNAQWFYGNVREGEASVGGLYIKDGKVLGAATQGRGGVLLTHGGRKLDVDAYTARTTLKARGASYEVDGINRAPGVITNCGGIGGDQPTENPQHDLQCTDDSELVQITSDWAGRTPAGEGLEVVLGADDRVVAVNEQRGTDLPEGGSSIQAIGEQVDWLREHATVGTKLQVTTKVKDSAGRNVPLTPDTDLLQVGPTLVDEGEVSVNAVADGLFREGTDQTFTYNWVLRSNPRSAIGRDDEGRLMLVVVDGRQAGYSEGLGINEWAHLMHDLGAVEALNLDGGGSSVMATREGLVNRPSDAAGQRSLGNVVLVQP